MTTLAQQIEHEQTIDAKAEAVALQELQDNLQTGNIDKLPKAKLLLGNLFPAVRKSIADEQAQVARGAGAKMRGWLRKIDPDVAAVISIRCALRIILGGNIRAKDSKVGATFQRIAAGIAREWVQEVQIRQAESVNPAYYAAAMKGLEQANVSSRKHVSMTVNRVIRNTLEGVYDNPLNETELVQLGKFGLQACLDAGLVEIERSTWTGGHVVVYKLPDAVLKFLGDPNHALAMVRGTNTPMHIPPLEWSALVGGGYTTERRQLRYPLVNYRKLVRRSHAKLYHQQQSVEQMPQVYSYVNYAQSIPFCIDAEVLRVVDAAWKAGGGRMGLPKVAPPEKPVFPFGEDWSKATAPEAELEVFQRWKRATTRWHEARRKHQSQVWEVHSFLRHVREHGDGPMYFPVFLDSRSRMYYRTSPNPQGSDASKAVIHFHRKKMLGARGVYWLKVHIANCFGVDRPKFDQRAAWADEHWPQLSAALADPVESGVFDEADSPLCALAACMELARAYSTGNPATYATGLIVHMDATCSGLQHFSAMLRDPTGAKYVNLLPGGEEKADIYRRVAELVELQLARDAEGGNQMAVIWQGVGITRNLAKKPVMTYVYGATLQSVADGCSDYLDDLGYKSDGISVTKLSYYLAKLMFKAVEDTVPAAAAAMRWLRQLMRKVPKDKPVQWVTPLGFTVYHDYRDEERKRVRIRSCDMEYVVMYRKLDTLAPLSMQNAISPNFVHSLDGTHLGMTVLRMQAGQRDIACIHDSFGTHPCDVDAMHVDIRDAFHSMYQRDMLHELGMQVGVDIPYPPIGTLDLDAVKRSEFFFC